MGAGLATKQGQTPEIPGFNATAHKNDRGSHVDAKTLEGTAGSQLHHDRQARPSRRERLSPLLRTRRSSSEILAIGDSVMLGAVDSLGTAIPGIFVDAKVSRQFKDATIVLQHYKTEGLLPPTIVVHMGTNGDFNDSDFDQLMAVVGQKRKVFFVNAANRARGRPR